MLHRTALCLLLVAFLRPASADEDVRVIELESDGTRIIGRIVPDECTDEILVVREIRGNAKRRIPWEDIRPGQATDLRVELGFEIAEVAQGALKIEGHEIRNKAGSTFRGVLQNPDTAASDGYYAMKTDEGVLRIQLTDVVDGPNATVIDARQAYTSRELYEKKLKEKAPASAEDHFLLAEYCVAVGALDEAKTHYEKALELNDPRYTAEKIERSLVRIDGLLKNRAALEELKAIKRHIHYNNFPAASEGITAFRGKWTDASLVAEVDSLEEELKNERDSYYLARVPRLLRDTVRDLLGKRVKEQKEWTLREATKYASGAASSDDSVTRHALDAVAADLGLKGDEVLDFWNRREKRNTYKAFYRDGTFVVVDDLEDALSKAPKVKPPKGGGNVKLPQPRKQVTPDAWWESKVKARKHTDLRDWLFAYWAEKSQMCEVLEPKHETCQTCAGKGYLQSMVTTPAGSVPFFDRCGTCHMATYLRIVKFK